ncbi:MAG: proton extrusion protein PcxA [Synechococcales bacterium]|nr:proton extrusion protein PcxA [Synechococcales bacterium]
MHSSQADPIGFASLIPANSIMNSNVFNAAQGLFRRANRWFQKTPERALDEAYEAALTIKSIEDTHFDGGRITPEYGNYSQSVQAYFQAELKKYLNIIKVRLAEFNTSNSIFRVTNLSGQTPSEIRIDDSSPDVPTVDVIDPPRAILNKLKFIDEVLVRYRTDPPATTALSRRSPDSLMRRRNGMGDGAIAFARTPSGQPPLPDPRNVPVRRMPREGGNSPVEGSGNPRAALNSGKLGRSPGRNDSESFADKTGVLPRSILRTVDRIKRELDPQAEQEVVDNFRDSKTRTIISLRFILLLIIIPLLTQQVSKNFVVGPIVDHVRGDTQANVFLNMEMEEEALHELQRFDERLRFEILIGKTPPLSEEEIETRIQEKAAEVEAEYEQRSADAIKNVFADILSVIAVVGVLSFSKREIATLKAFIDELIYGLSDSAKAFIIILFTDTFVGFHSPHGWEVILEGISRHLGLPANRDFIFLFIATFPVILDTVFKYWIFRYLNRISPSAVATYKNMNE